MSSTITREVTVASRVGLHARPAAAVVKTATEQPAVVKIAKGEGQAMDCRSMLSLLAIGAKHGDVVTLSADGDGAQASIDAVAEIILTDMDEPEES